MVAESIITTSARLINLIPPKMMYGKIPVSNDTIDCIILLLTYTLEEQTKEFCVLSHILLK